MKTAEAGARGVRRLRFGEWQSREPVVSLLRFRAVC
jgi:hypothetical protein